MGVKVREKVKGSGKYWVFVNHQGTRQSRAFEDKKTAQRAADMIKAALVLGDLGSIDQMQQSDCPSLREQAELWLVSHYDWKESTRELHENTLRVHVYPAIGSKRLDEITPKILKSFFEKLLSKGLSYSMIKIIKAPLMGIFKNAVNEGHIESNPLNKMGLSLPKKAQKEIVPLTEDQVEKLLDCAQNYRDGVYYPVILCALRTGMRIGEIQALEWSDIDFESRMIRIKAGWRKGRKTTTKSGKSRSVGMTKHLTETLKSLKREKTKIALKAGLPISKLVFRGVKNEMLNRVTFKNALDACLDQAGLPRIRVHDLRHTYATTRLLRGHNPGDVSHQLGHSSIKITFDTYGHWLPGKFQDEVDSLDFPDKSAPNLHPEDKAFQKC